MDTQQVSAVITRLDMVQGAVNGAAKELVEVQTKVEGMEGEMARFRKIIHGNGDPSGSLLSRQKTVELQLDELRKSLEERVPRVATIRGIPIYWWLIAILLIIVVGLIVLVAASKGLLDANVLATEAAKTGRAVVESQLQPDPQGAP